MDVAVEDKVREKKDIKHMKIISNWTSISRVHERKKIRIYMFEEMIAKYFFNLTKFMNP